MAWREEAKELGIPLYHRKKADVLAEIQEKKLGIAVRNALVKMTISGQEATAICIAALKEYVRNHGLSEPITHEKWFVNCKRKGIVFTGAKHDTVEQNEQAGREEIDESGDGGGS